MKILVVLPFDSGPNLERMVHVAALPLFGSTLRFNLVEDYDDEATVELVEIQTGKSKPPAFAAEVWLSSIHDADDYDRERLLKNGWKVRQ